MLFFIVTYPSFSQVPSYVDTNGLVGWWPFDGNANDISGNGNNGLVYGATLTTDRNLNTNSAYSFNGSSYISVANSALLSSLISEGTISLWTVSNFGGGSPICKSGSSLLGDFRIQHSTSNVSFIINGKDYSINGIFPAGQWINIVMTYKNSTAKLYINGNLIGSLATPSNTYTIDRINSLDFGRDPWGSMEYHNGKIDDIGIWNKALDSNKVKQLYNATPCNLSYQLPQDTITSCNQDSVLLNAGVGFTSYNWSNGDSTQMTFAKATGMYSVQVTDSNGCSAEDSVFVSIINDSIIQNDTTICKGDSVSLSVSQPIGQALTICNGNNLPSNLQTGLVGYWPFCGNANDESGNGNNGTVNGATLTTDRFGNANSAYDFDGVNDYLDFGNPTLLNPTPFSYSQSCWIKLVDYSAIQDPILSKRHQDNGNDWATALIKSDGKVSFFSDDKQHYTTNFATSPVLDSSFWYQFTFVKNGYSYIMYMNGYLVDSIYDTHIMGGTNDNFIAGKQGAWNAFFKGKIDDIGIWNRALSSSEAQQLYSNGAQQTYQWSTGDTTSSILVSPDSTTTYYVTISNGIHSCVDSVTVTVNNPQFQFAQDSVSGCDTVTVNAGSGWSAYAWSSGDTNQSVSFTNTGMKVLTVTDSIGCTATDSIYVTVNTYVTTAISDSSCDQYTWSQTGITYGSSGTYRDTVPTAVGCDSIISLNLVIYNLDTVRLTVVSCDSFNWPQTGLTYASSGLYQDSLINSQGCDSILLLDLTITQTTSSTISAAACDSFTWLLNGMTYNSSGVYSDTITNSQGCDSIVSLNLTINTLSYQLPQDTMTSCFQDSVLLDAGTGFTTYNWSNGDSTQTSYVSATGMYSVQVSDSNGCSAEDSVFISIINDTILQNDTTICKGDSISLSVGIPQPTNLLIDSITIRMDSVWDYYFTSLDTTRNYLLKVNGLWANCCAHLNYDVAFGGITWSSISPVIWNSSAIYFHMDGLPFPRPTPDVYTTSHQYDYPLSPLKDSIEISFYDNPTTDNIGALRFRLFQLIDPSSLTYLWSTGDTTSSISVSPDSTITYYVTISNGIHSCVDSVTVTVNNPQFQFAQDSVSGCDTVTVNAGSGWSAYAWSSGDTNQSVSFTNTGMKVLTVTDSIGCTATDSIYVTVNTYVTTAISDSSCDQYTWSQTGITYGSSGTYRDTVPTAVGCDSIISLNLVIYNLDTVRLTVVSCDSFNWPQTGLTYASSGLYQDSLINSQGCDSILLLDLTITQTTSSTISAAACDSFTWLLNGMTYNSSGVYSDTITNSQGCDSIVSLNLTINTLSYQLPQDTMTSCFQDSVLLDAGTGFTTYNWSNGDSTQTSYVSATGMYSVQVSDSNGCSAEDSVFISIINDTILQNDTTICKGDSVSFSVYQLQVQVLTICNSNNLPSNLQTGLVGYWPFCGNANDESGNVNNGIVSGASLTTDRLGTPNSAYDFDGVNDYISLSQPYFNGGTSISSLSFSTWVKVDQFPASGATSCFIAKEGFWRTVSLQVNSLGKIYFGGSQPSPQGYFGISTGNNAISLNTWSLLTVTYNNGLLKLYINGILSATANISYSTLNFSYLAAGNSTSTNLIGASNPVSPGITNYVNGSIDDLSYWNRALSASEVLQLNGSASGSSGSSNYLKTYFWSTGDTTSSISVSPDSTTTYYVTISNGIHSCLDSVTVTVSNPQFQFAQDSVSGCDTVTVNAGSGWSSYTWSSGDTTQSTSFTTTGMKYLTVTDTIGCTASDSIYVTVNTYVTTTLSDTSCDEFTWSQTGVTYTVSGIYSDTVSTTFGCDSILELNLVLFNSTSSIDTVVNCESFTWQQTGFTYFTSGIYRDTLVNSVGCDSLLSLVLTINNITYSNTSITACDSFTWTQTNTTYFTSGNYQDTVLNSKGCDSVINLNLLVYPTITPIIGSFQNLCENDAIFNFTASPPGGAWTGPGISLTGLFDPAIAGEGIHTIIYTAVGQCANSDTVLIEVYDIPFINGLIKDDECNEGIGSIKTTVTGGATPYTYLWNDRVNTKDNLGLTEGTYALTVTDDNGCKGDYVGSLLNLQDDSCDDTYLFVPNIFSPDGNGVNDILFVDGKNIQQVQLMIYNRWGNLVFQSNSVAEGWDGNFKGKPVNQGVFVYIVTGRFKDGKDFDQKGTITLIRKK